MVRIAMLARMFNPVNGDPSLRNRTPHLSGSRGIPAMLGIGLVSLVFLVQSIWVFQRTRDPLFVRPRVKLPVANQTQCCPPVCSLELSWTSGTGWLSEHSVKIPDGKLEELLREVKRQCGHTGDASRVRLRIPPDAPAVVMRNFMMTAQAVGLDEVRVAARRKDRSS